MAAGSLAIFAVVIAYSRNRIIDLSMSSHVLYRRPARGRPAMGFQLEAPRELELRDGAVLTCREVRQDGRIVGELEASLFVAALIIDRDGILAEKAEEAIAAECGARGGPAAGAAAHRRWRSSFRAPAAIAPMPW